MIGNVWEWSQDWWKTKHTEETQNNSVIWPKEHDRQRVRMDPRSWETKHTVDPQNNPVSMA